MASLLKARAVPDGNVPGTDAAVIGRSMREPEYFAAIFDRYYAPIHGYVARRLGHSTADDVAAETFLVAFTGRGGYDRTRLDARPWLYGIASNLISQHLRAEQRRYRALARAGAAEPGAGDSEVEHVAVRLDAQARRAALAAALAEIPDGDRDVLLLSAWAGLTSDEVGRALGIPAGTVRSRLHRARRQVRAALDRAEPDTTRRNVDNG